MTMRFVILVIFNLLSCINIVFSFRRVSRNHHNRIYECVRKGDVKTLSDQVKGSLYKSIVKAVVLSSPILFSNQIFAIDTDDIETFFDKNESLSVLYLIRI